jgi:glycosyltransferase involved in cell wall biosynthesis
MQKTAVQDLKIAIVHDYLNQYGGAERCLEVFHSLFPKAPIYTLVYKKEALPQYADWDIRPCFLQSLPLIQKHYKYFFPLFPFAVRTFDFKKYDCVLTISHAWVKGIKKRKAKHICYCLTPVRYAWDLYDEYLKHEYIPKLFKVIMPFLGWCLRTWDKAQARKVDSFISISDTVKTRVKKFYGRDSTVIYPPADLSYYTIDSNVTREDFYITVSRFKAYKRIDLIVEAFKKMNKPLVVIGSGTEYESLKRRAGALTRFETTLSDTQVRDYYRRARGFVFAGVEDFGLVNVEAEACGLPVIAYNEGGASEVVVDGKSGVLFNEQTVEGVIKGIQRFESLSFDPCLVRECALKFDRKEFEKQIIAFIEHTI